MNHFCVSIVLATAITAAAQGLPASAQEYPSRVITVLTPATAGGPSDLPFRLFMEQMKEDWNATVVLENRPGGGGSIATEAVIRAQADGHTLLFGGGSVWLQPILTKDLRFDPYKDLVPVSLMLEFYNFLVTNAQTPAKNLDELIGYAKANPGKVNFGTILRNAAQIQAEGFNQAAGVRIASIPYAAQAPFIQALLRNDVQLVAASPGGGVKGMIDEGRLRALMVFGGARSPLIPDVPSASERGWNLPTATVYGIYAPAATPRPIVDKIAAEMRRFAADPKAQKAALDSAGARLVGQTPEEARRQLDGDLKVWSGLAATLGIKPE
jgi:tripartite-type tricarboxylate transporter receptor subunit TctC